MTVDQWSDTMPLAMALEVIVQAFVYKTKPRASLSEVFQQIRERMEAIAKGIVSDHWS